MTHTKDKSIFELICRNIVPGRFLLRMPIYFVRDWGERCGRLCVCSREIRETEKMLKSVQVQEKIDLAEVKVTS